MGDRLDLSRFTPTLQDRPQTPQAEAIEQCVENAAGRLWSLHDTSEGLLDSIGDLQLLRAALRRLAGLGGNAHPSIALVDWTALHHARLLVTEPNEVRDPFTALADLASVVAAVLFYDRVLVIPEAAGADEALELGDLVRPMPITLPGVPEGIFQELLDSHYFWARGQLQMASTAQDPPSWFSALAEAWAELLPGVTLPSHDIDRYPDATFQSSPRRGDSNAVIFQRESAWTLSRNLEHVILDNDLRALFYERLASTLQALLKDDTVEPSVQYVGGCLRSPLLLARAHAAEAALLPGRTPENWLQQSWQQLFQSQSHDVQAPFWLQAVLAASRDRREIPAALARLRRAGRAYRNHRQELSHAVVLQDLRTLRTAHSALAGDVQALTRAAQAAGAGVDVITSTLKITAPVVPTELISAAARAAGAQSGWLNKLAVRLFRPRLWFLVQLGIEAERGTNVLPHAARLFSFAGLDATEPSNFLTRIGRTTWIA